MTATTPRAVHTGALALLLASSCVTPAPHAATAPDTSDGTEMVQVRGAWLRVLDTGAAPEGADVREPPVVFVHGFGSRLESWRVVQPAIARTRRTISFDQRGFGLSERTADARLAGQGYGPEAHAADLEALLNGRPDPRGLDRVVLVGHSYGAGVVLRFALRHPERVAGVVLVSPFALDEQLPTSFRWARAPGVGEYLFAASWRGFAGEKYLLAFHDPLRTSSRSRTARDAPLVSAAALDEVEALQEREGSTFAQLATVRAMDYAGVEAQYASLAAHGVPVTLVWGRDDRITPFRTSRSFLATIPHATLVPLEQCGHMPSWERPDDVTRAILEVTR